MSFGWSAGDIIAAATFIFEVAQALDEVSGAARDFREASTFLNNLITALKPLETFTALDSHPSYKADIEREVKSIRTPVEAFISEVKSIQSSLGVVKDGKFRHLQNIPSKLKWHFSISKKALALQQNVERHLRVINTLMQQLTVDMLDKLQKVPERDVRESIDERLKIHLPAFQGALLADLSQRDDCNQNTRNAELKRILEDLLENYLGSQRVMPRISPTPITSTVPTSALLESLSFLSSRHQIEIIENCRYPIDGISTESDTVLKMKRWISAEENMVLWVQTAPRESHKQSLASDVVALANEAGIPVLVHFSQLLDPDGRVLSQLETLSNMVYSLVYQLCLHITSKRVELPSVTMVGAAKLDGSTHLLPQALDVLRDCLAAITDNVLLVLDGIDIIDYSNDAFVEQRLRDLLRLLCNSKYGSKTLITTEGHSAVVLEEIGWSNTMDASIDSGSDGFFSLEDLRGFLEPRGQ